MNDTTEQLEGIVLGFKIANGPPSSSTCRNVELELR